MYQFTQKHKKFILIVVVVLLLPFIGVSIDQAFRGPGGGGSQVVGSFVVGGEKVSVTRDDFLEAERRLKIGSGGRRGSLGADEVWLQLAHLAEADRAGIRVSDAAVAEQVQGLIDALGRSQKRQGTVEDYKRYLRAMKILPRDFERAIREVETVRRFRSMHVLAQDVDLEKVKEAFEETNRTFVVKVARFSVDDAEAKLKDVDFPLEPKLKTFYDDESNKVLLRADEDLMNPRRFVRLEVVHGSIDQFDPAKHAEFLKDEEPTDDLLRNLYERLKDELYKLPAPKEEPKEEKDPKDPPKDNPDAAPPADTPTYKPFEDVKDDVRRRALFQRFLEKVVAAATVKLDEAKAAQEQPKAGETLPPAPLDLKAIADTYGLTHELIENKTAKDLEAREPFATKAEFLLGGQAIGLSQGQLAPRAALARDYGFGFFTRLLEDKARELKPLSEIESGVRKVAKRAAARDAAQASADAFYAALQAAVKAQIADELEKEVYAPLREQQAKEVADANEARKKDEKPALTAEDPEMKAIVEKFDELRKRRETPRLEKAYAEKMGDVFEPTATAESVPLAEYRLREPSNTRDFQRRRREIERFPVKGFLRYNTGLGRFEKGEVSSVLSDYDRANAVMKVIDIVPPSWDRISPATYEELVEQERRMMLMSAAQHLGYESLDKRYKLDTHPAYRTQPDDE